MPTSVHIPPLLLARADRRAQALNISRNRLIVNALEHELAEESSWSPGFIASLREVDQSTASAVNEMMKVIRKARRSKGPPRL